VRGDGLRIYTLHKQTCRPLGLAHLELEPGLKAVWMRAEFEDCRGKELE
jgi:hypothetical protein